MSNQMYMHLMVCGIYGGIQIILPKQEENNYENLITPTKIFTVYLFAGSMYFTVTRDNAVYLILIKRKTVSSWPYSSDW